MTVFESHLDPALRLVATLVHWRGGDLSSLSLTPQSH